MLLGSVDKYSSLAMSIVLVVAINITNHKWLSFIMPYEHQEIIWTGTLLNALRTKLHTDLNDF